MFRFILAIALVFSSVFSVIAQSEMIVIDKQARSANPTLHFAGINGSAEINQNVRNCLILCGWFDVVRSNRCDYIVTGQADGNDLTLRVTNSAGREIVTVTAKGNNAGEAARRGVDRILRALFNIAGICQSRIVFTVETGRGRKEIAMCNFDAIVPTFGQSEEMLNKKIAEYALAVVKDKPNFHVSLAIDISPCCDCHSENDIPIVPNVGMFASFDPVAIDVAAADGVNAMPVNPQSVLGRKEQCCRDHFTNSYPNTDWRVQVDHAERIGLGSTEYELVLI